MSLHLDEYTRMSVGSLFSELRRRQVIRTCFLYILLCWGIVQVAEILAPPLGYDSDAVIRFFLFAAFLGFPVTIVLAWFYKITSSGIERTHAFVERRILNNIPPINDRRRSNVGGYFSKGRKEQPEYDWILSAETGPLSGLSFAICQDICIGRSLDCDLAVVTPHVSRQHALLSIAEDTLTVKDLDSSNGTLVNGKKIESPYALHHDDEIRLYDIVFKVSENFTRSYSERKSMSETTFIPKSDTGE